MQLATNQNGSLGVAVDATTVYWTNHVGGTVQSVPTGGGTVTPLASGQSGAGGIAVDANSVYWANYANGTPMMKWSSTR